MQRNNRFFLRKIGDTYFLQCSGSLEQKMVFLNGTGAFLWERLPECEAEEDLVKGLLAAYDVQPSIAEKDVSEFLDFLTENGCMKQEG